ncbi:cation-translocating P-type ATPase [Sulfurimonas sp.]|uniref:cation-translocating P-type ATPase n=1 Tax=Sulfurimonas sp. TaxID=2022749 RepID=UPI0025E5840F|nr:cation-translocating P-type ATPase [Sulfurimonas sp.]MDD5157342.1 cation-translocating P-type ATPase [Sulfurimonas sp.]
MNENKLPHGLSAVEALQRRNKEGFNELEIKHNRSTFKIILEVVREPMFLLLLSAGGIYLIMGDAHEAVILLGFVFVIMGITIIQERRTEKVLEALRDLSSPRALVIRDGVQIRISGREVVRGDTLILNEGDRIPADGFILSSHDLAADESMLSGESVAIAKYADDPSNNKLYAGTLTIRGQAIIEVTAIGALTELGKIGKSLQSIENEASPLQKETALLTKHLAIVGIALCFVVIILFVLFRGGWLEGILAGITLAMGILPQEFPVIMIIFMALGARRIAQHNVLTRRLSAIETLGKTTVLCVDKTGTLTKNQMAVAALALRDKFLSIANLDELPEDFHEIVEYCILASQTDPHDPMEKAFYTLANRYLLHTEHLHFDWNLTKEYELAPDLLAMSHLWQIQKQHHHPVATKGAPEAIIDLCHLDAQKRDEIMQQVAAMADQGLRVLGVAKAVHIGEEWPAIQHDFEFEFLGLVGLADPLRDEVPQAAVECRSAGIRIVMITGDHPRTAKAIAKQAGIDSTTVITGAELETLHGDELAACIQKASVFARVSPQQKLQIVEALKSNGEIVAMTGDGVNDAPALKSAHIGIAMGKRGTDVAREAASLVLLEDNFGAIVEAIKLGRRIFNNLRHAMIYTIAVHIPIIGLSILPIIFGLPLVLAPIHIVFLELIIDPACSVVFEAEEASADIMAHPPRLSHEHLISSKHLILSLLQGGLAAIAVALLYSTSLSVGVDVAEARAMAFIALASANTVLIFNSRSHEHSFRQSFTAVSTIGLWVISTTLLSLMAITIMPSIAIYFSFAPPSLSNWLIAFGTGISMFVLFEIVKKGVLSYSSR